LRRTEQGPTLTDQLGTVEDDAIISHLQSLRGVASAVEIARTLAEIRGESSQAAFVCYFKRAFPDIRLQTLTACAAWTSSGISDCEFADALRPWLGPDRVD
jgi:hypothetical protein